MRIEVKFLSGALPMNEILVIVLAETKLNFVSGDGAFSERYLSL